MRRAAALLCLLCLCGCTFSRTVETDENGIREHYKTLSETRLRAEVQAEFPDRVSMYLLEYHFQRDGDGSITVIEPKSIAGVTVTLQSEETVLSVDEMRLETGTLDENGLSPISALPNLMKQWQTLPSEIETISEDGEELLLLVYNEEETSYRTVFSRKTYKPVRAEIFSGGKCVLRLKYVT